MVKVVVHAADQVPVTIRSVEITGDPESAVGLVSRGLTRSPDPRSFWSPGESLCVTLTILQVI